MAMKRRMKGGPRQTITSLTVMVKAVERGMWPTPNASDGTGGRVSGDRAILTGQRPSGAKVQVSLGDAIRREQLRSGSSDQPRGQLNPMWVEWLMGFPLGWTVCESWGTRSSRRSRNGSEAA